MRCARKTCLNNLSLKSKLLESHVKAPNDASQCSKIHVDRDGNLLPSQAIARAWETKKVADIHPKFCWTVLLFSVLRYDLHSSNSFAKTGCAHWMDVPTGVHPMVCVSAGSIILAEELKLENAPHWQGGGWAGKHWRPGTGPPLSCLPPYSSRRTKHLTSPRLTFQLTTGSAALSHSRTGHRGSHWDERSGKDWSAAQLQGRDVRSRGKRSHRISCWFPHAVPLQLSVAETETKKRKDMRETDRKRQDWAPAEISITLLASDLHLVPATKN